jgi:hypothetical protein
MATLRGAPSSPSSRAFVATLGETIETLERSAGRRTRKRKADAHSAFLKALGAVLADILKASHGLPDRGYVYRSLHAESFNTAPVAYRAFVAAVEGLWRLGLIERVAGFKNDEITNWGDTGVTVIRNRKASRFRATPKLVHAACAQGITAESLGDHFSFAPEPPKERPLLVLKASAKGAGARKVDGQPMEIVETPETIRLASEVRAINEFLGRVAITGLAFHGLHRAFAMGDVLNYRWDKGGRLYAYGDAYQTAKKAARLAMTLNGEPVVEIDIKASHLTILHALLGAPLDIGEDAYDGLGVDREVAKTWLTATLGKGAPVKRWPKTASEEYRKRTGRNLSGDHRADFVGASVMARFPLLFKLKDTGISWADLTFRESEAVVGAVLELAREGVPALPVHDSLIVPATREHMASAILISNFERVVGVQPRLKANVSPRSSPTAHHGN